MLPSVGGLDVRAVHRTRVASRRLRELLPILQLDGHTNQKLAKRLRKITRRLGKVRELDVATELIDVLRETKGVPERGLRRMEQSVRQSLDEARRHLQEKGVASDVKRAAKKLETIAVKLEHADKGRSNGRTWRWAVDARVARRADALKEAVGEAGSMYVPDRLHRVRLALKKLRYGLELAEQAAGVKESADVRVLRRRQELLGRLRDRQVLIERVREVQAAMSTPDLAAWRELDTLITALEAGCRRIHARYVRERAAIANLCDRLGTRAAASAARRAG
jgi:CHAD domain-containing protein